MKKFIEAAPSLALAAGLLLTGAPAHAATAPSSAALSIAPNMTSGPENQQGLYCNFVTEAGGRAVAATMHDSRPDQRLLGGRLDWGDGTRSHFVPASDDQVTFSHVYAQPAPELVPSPTQEPFTLPSPATVFFVVASLAKVDGSHGTGEQASASCEALLHVPIPELEKP